MSASGPARVVAMESANANAIDEELLDRVESELSRASESGAGAVVLTGHDKFFSAGLNLKGLPEDRAGMARFVDRFEAFNLSLLRFPLPVVAAVNGHAIAGGCVLACTADYRVGARGDYKLGVSEVSLGIVFPATAFEIMRAALNPEAVPDVLLDGALLDPERARSAGILHRVVPPEELLSHAVERAEALAAKPREAYVHTKLAIRAPMLERIEREGERARKGFLDSWFRDDVVARRKAMLS